MVIYVDWLQATVEPRSDSFLPMTGEGSGLEALALPQAGYLGKVQERAASLVDCPWCTSKGLTYPLRSYRINLKESITLCTNPQCLFPLVTRPLEDVLASLDPVDPTVGIKRRSLTALEEEEEIKCPLKRQRPDKGGDLLPETVSCSPVGSLEHCFVNPVTNGHNGNPNTGSKVKVNGCQEETPGAQTAERDNGVQSRVDSALPACSSNVGLSKAVALSPRCISPDVSKTNHVSTLKRCSRTVSMQAITAEKDILACEDINSFHSESQGSSHKLVSVPKQLLWRNEDNLCWLDSLLAFLVNCKSLRKLRLEDEPEGSSVWRLLKEHEDICAAVQPHQQTGTDAVPTVPSHVLQKANDDLQSLRMSVFKLLEPKLRCKLGQEETPVFAMPLLLTLDPWVENLFQTTYLWEFKCSECKVTTRERGLKTLPTFTNIVPDWTPLNAVHFAPCNVCHKKNQMRTMLLESLPSVFALHFVEGLPHNDLSNYTFTFKGKRYSVTAVIQYSRQLKHFVTWIHNEDGSWLEYDDLKHPVCETSPQLQIPAQEIHVVFWEVEENSLLDPPLVEAEGVAGLKDTEEPSAQGSDQTLLASPNDTDIVSALSEVYSPNLDSTVETDVDRTIGATTLLDTFEGLTHSDIITLTLVEPQPESLQSETEPLKETQQTEDPGAHLTTEKVVSSPDSSILAAGGTLFPDADPRPAPTSSPSDSESVEDSASDPLFVPNAKRKRGRKANRRKTGRGKRCKKASSKDAPQIAPPEPLQPPEPIHPAPNTTAPVTEQTSMVSSTNNSPPSSSQNDRWSYITSKHRVIQASKNVSHPPSTLNGTVKLFYPVHSTPHPFNKLPIPRLPPKVPLVTGDDKGLPPKAAEMYGSFGAKSSSPVTPIPSPSPVPQIPPAIPGSRPSPPTWMSGTSPPLLTEISHKKPCGTKAPPVFSDTEALRYKLLKKLKAKKKKLAKLDELLAKGGGGAQFRPDSTDLNSPSTVSSSTYDGSTCDDVLSELLTPATTASNLSPDSTDFLEMLAGGQNRANQLDCVGIGAGGISQINFQTNQQEDHNFLEEFLSQF